MKFTTAKPLAFTVTEGSGLIQNQKSLRAHGGSFFYRLNLLNGGSLRHNKVNLVIGVRLQSYGLC